MQRYKTRVGKIVRLRMVKYYLLGNVALAVNFIVFNIGLRAGLGVVTAYGIAYFIGGQVNFWMHDRKTFGDRNPELDGWLFRWLLFMSVNVSALGLSSAVTWLLNHYGMPHLLVYAVAMIASALFNFTGNNFVSHRDRRDNQPQPKLSVERSEAA